MSHVLRALVAHRAGVVLARLSATIIVVRVVRALVVRAQNVRAGAAPRRPHNQVHPLRHGVMDAMLTEPTKTKKGRTKKQ